MKYKIRKIFPIILLIGLVLNIALLIIINIPREEDDQMPVKYYNYLMEYDELSGAKRPSNNHMIFEVSSTKVYFVDSSNVKVLLKLDPSTGTITTITTRTNKDIARAYHDRDNTIIYFCDCDYDDTTSYIWSFNTSTEAINEITSIPADVFDIWIYDSDLYYYYFGSGGYALETETIDPDGDGGTLEWTSTDDPNHSTTVDEGATPNTADYISSETDEDQDILTFPNGLDLSAYDYHGVDPTSQIYELVVKLYGKGGKVNVSGPVGLGMDTPQTITFDSADYAWQQATFSGLSLEDSDIDDLEVILEHEQYNGSYISFTNIGNDILTEYGGPVGVVWDGTYFYVVMVNVPSVDKFNSSFVLQASYDISSETAYPEGIAWDGTYFYLVSYGEKKVYKYDASFNYTSTSYSIGGTILDPHGMCWDGTYFYITSLSEDKIYKYNSTFEEQASYSVCNSPSGIEWDGNFFYITDYFDEIVYKYNSLFVQQAYYSLSVPHEPRGICWRSDVNYFYIILGADDIYWYNAGYCTIATVRTDLNFYGDVEVALVIKNHTNNTSTSSNMGSTAGREWDSSQVAIVDDQFWFLWKWSNENAELWKFDVSDDAFTEMEDCGSTTEIPTFNQNGIAYDEIDVLSFVLGTGTAEVSTIVAADPATIDDGDYITYSAISLDSENNRSETDYYIWFDKVGDESGDPAPADKTKITVDISAAVDAQDVSDAIQAAIDAVDTITAANGGGTSTTVTITNHYNGNVTNIADVDSGLSVATVTPGVDNTYYYYTYAITGDTLTQLAEYVISLMLDRNTDSSNDVPFNLEKAISLATREIYQISRTRGNFYKISDLTDSNVLVDGTLIAITDTYLFILRDSGKIELWKYQDVMGYVTNMSFTSDKQDFDIGKMMWDSTKFTIKKGMFLQFIGTRTEN